MKKLLSGAALAILVVGMTGCCGMKSDCAEKGKCGMKSECSMKAKCAESGKCDMKKASTSECKKGSCNK